MKFIDLFIQYIYGVLTHICFSIESLTLHTLCLTIPYDWLELPESVDF